MAKTNYQQLRRQKETARKNRRQTKLDRRAQKDSSEAATANVDSAAPAVLGLPANNASN